MSPRSSVELEVAAVREDARALSERLRALRIPAHARLFQESVDEAIHHLGVVSLRLANALVIGLPGVPR